MFFAAVLLHTELVRAKRERRNNVIYVVGRVCGGKQQGKRRGRELIERMVVLQYIGVVDATGKPSRRLSVYHYLPLLLQLSTLCCDVLSLP